MEPVHAEKAKARRTQRLLYALTFAMIAAPALAWWLSQR